MRNANIHLTFGVLLAGLFLTQPLSAQLPGASPATLGTAYNYTALARGFAAIGLNPAGLGMPGNQGFAVAILPTAFHQSLDPLTFSDIFDYEGVVIPGSVKGDWLERISAANGQTGAGQISLTEFSASWNQFGIQVSTIASGRSNLNEDVAELVLFGNAGRTGSPGDFDAQGSYMDGFAVTTLGLSVGFPLSRRWAPGARKGLAVGVTLKQSWGHALVFAEDNGSVANSDPLGMELSFPVVHPQEGWTDFNQGNGLGMDVGLSWQEGPISAAVVVQNIFNTFEWDLATLAFRPGEAVFDESTKESDFDERPATEAPESIRTKVKDLNFRPVFVLGGAYEASDNLTVTGELRQRAGEGLQTGPKSHLGVGVVFTPHPSVPLRAGIAAITEGIQVAGGFGFILGPMHLGFGGLLQTGDVGDGFAGTFGLSFGGG